ncbi:MAG TPA: T9SS type A sorting domain-containing protein [Flavobacteriales bacterium]|nr:T9SS type A sorting domain-containing protein [Flavobacteriales bacterium]MCB0781848.1 T9SS type A sorting domain-containing protein [Flavobacteriales bacterium]MCB0784709.1 T9SS type A sorting domain-containing protein [Flavobacteriales bacterium]MCB0788634.1 T9SS type A sorting domain-containing protein [Flavobacteriales bacterium]MCB0809311.1 T9SS type A sorting domain-containing protein [Flavobacteriales bacterium]
MSVRVDQDGFGYVLGEYRDTVDLDPGPWVDIRTSKGVRDAFLVQVDGTTLAQRERPQPGIGLSPNPTSGTLHMRLHDPFPEADLEVRDITGRLVLAPGRALSTHAFDVSILAAGTYLLVDRTGTFAGQRFVKEWGVPETSSEVQDPR